MAEYKNIKIQPDTFNYLKKMKPDGVTWDRFLRQAANTWDGMRDR